MSGSGRKVLLDRLAQRQFARLTLLRRGERPLLRQMIAEASTRPDAPNPPGDFVLPS
jgi:hypothetical protein